MTVKLNLLFVDDEPRILSAFRRQLRNKRGSWDISYAQSGEDALAVLHKKEIDIIISDMRMPGMDGAKLLGIVQEFYPRTVRVVLSGYSDRDMASRAVKSAHQFLAKPCSLEHLQATLERAILLRGLLKNEHLQAMVASTSDLPSVPSLYASIVEELNAPRPSMDRIGKIISADVSMTARMLQLVNSPYFGLRYEIRNIHHAVNYLGFETIKSLVLMIQVFHSFGRESEALQKFCEHSLLVANLAKKIALSEGAEPEEAENAFTAGILHDIGWLVLFQSKELAGSNFAKEAELMLLEHKLWGSLHSEIGGYLLGIWGLPTDIVRIVAHHHRPSDAEWGGISLAAVHSSENLAIEREDHWDYLYLDKLGLTECIPRWRELFRQMQEEGFEK